MVTFRHCPIRGDMWRFFLNNTYATYRHICFYFATYRKVAKCNEMWRYVAPETLGSLTLSRYVYPKYFQFYSQNNFFYFIFFNRKWKIQSRLKVFQLEIKNHVRHNFFFRYQSRKGKIIFEKYFRNFFRISKKFRTIAKKNRENGITVQKMTVRGIRYQEIQCENYHTENFLLTKFK